MSTTTTETKPNPKKTPEFKALVSALGSKHAATVAWNAAYPENPIKVKGAPDEGVPLTSAELVEALVAKAGLVPVRGRVYSTPEIIEAQVRVLKTGKPEVVRNGGNKHVKAVSIWRTDDGDTVAVQNLGEPN